MNAIQVVGPQRLQLIQVPEPEPQKGEVRWDGRPITRREPEEVAR